MPRQIGPVLARLEYSAIAPVVAALRSLPLERALKVGAALGAIAARADWVNRPIGMRNLEIAFPHKSVEQRFEILRGMYRNWGRMLAEWAHFGDLTRANIGQFVVYQGREVWDEAERISHGRGALVLTAHFGNFELLALAHSIYGYRIAIVHRPLRNPLIDRVVREARERFGNCTIARRGAGRTMVKLLREDWKVAVPLDLDVRKGVFVDFFGLKASTSDGLARLAMASGAPLAPVFLIRDGESAHHRIAIMPMIEIVRSHDRDEAIRENTQRFTRAIEDAVRAHPDHWNWIHRRWKTRPPGEARFY
jgi:Kdo2-lipid IVA lauroyltransferase/acyltransferase